MNYLPPSFGLFFWQITVFSILSIIPLKIAKDKFLPNFEFSKLNQKVFSPLQYGQLSLF